MRLRRVALLWLAAVAFSILFGLAIGMAAPEQSGGVTPATIHYIKAAK